MSTASRGNAAENGVCRDLEAQGWTVASRRHIGGAGDILAIHPRQRTRLIEVKSTAGGPFHGFPPADREALRDLAAQIDADPLLAHRRGGKTTWLAEADWPARTRRRK